MIELERVTKRYGSVKALSGVSLHVDKGSVLGLLGQNGAGKTTLLNILTGYLAPTEGRALIDGHDALLEPELAKRRLGYLPERPPLYEEMTVEEYLRFVSALKGVRERAIAAHVKDVMRRTGLTEMRERLLGHLSKGYQQRAGMAQALCADPDVLVFDEPTVGLDPKQITDIRELIRSLSSSHTIVFSSHILSEVQQLCNRVVILHRGEKRLDTALHGLSDGHITLTCAVLGSEKRLLAAARHLPGCIDALSTPAPEPDAVDLTLTFAPDAQPEKALFTLCSGMGAPILRLARCEDDLEQTFLRVISEQ